MLKPARSYEEACRTFRWRIPERYNVAFDICDRQTMAGADGHRTALVIEAADGSVERYTFHVLRLLSNRLANVLAAKGVGAGDRVAVSFGPSVEAAVAVLAVTRMGAVAVPVPTTLGTEPLAWRLAESGAVAAVVDGAVAARVEAVRAATPGLGTVLAAGEAPGGAVELWSAMELASDQFAPALTAADDPAFLFYPVDATGKPNGALHAHRALPGNLPAMEFALDFFPRFGDVLMTTGEWMCLEGLLWSLLPAWHHGTPVVARKGGLRAGEALGMMARYGVRAMVLPVTDLVRLIDIASAGPRPLLRALAVHGAVAAGLQEKVARVFGIPANEIWGTRETGGLAANNGALMELRPGSPGRAVPGVTVEAVDEGGRVMRAGERGMLAVAPGAPGGFLGYVGNPAPGTMRLPSGWLMTGQLGSRDLDGYLWPDAGTVVGDSVVPQDEPAFEDERQVASDRFAVRAPAPEERW
ncbi:MAG: AMP-binding protein [Pseudomonadota bacterium]